MDWDALQWGFYVQAASYFLLNQQKQENLQVLNVSCCHFGSTIILREPLA